ncbi:hypothetical protein KIN20_009544 [Parelaphostrongylus tenuis]|uniref:Uncharacterized protein n=1 Tax=Parelaphostrongylus tenuis TaxID=148309 RepID=A0AAD5QKQ1_PARTN|nr:hypothetical protein KIN20_009544 [Parelaphostrongylus tenuis]
MFIIFRDWTAPIHWDMLPARGTITPSAAVTPRPLQSSPVTSTSLHSHPASRQHKAAYCQTDNEETDLLN